MCGDARMPGVPATGTIENSKQFLASRTKPKRSRQLLAAFRPVVAGADERPWTCVMAILLSAL
jgi:hypothetical protein